MSEGRHPICRVVEEIPGDALYTDVVRRIIAFLKEGVDEYWTIDAENEQLCIVTGAHGTRSIREYPLEGFFKARELSSEVN